MQTDITSVPVHGETMHGFSPTPIDKLADAVIAGHRSPVTAARERDALREAILLTGLDSTKGRERVKCVPVSKDPLEDIAVTRAWVRVNGRTMLLSGSIPGLHDVLPEDMTAHGRFMSAVGRQLNARMGGETTRDLVKLQNHGRRDAALIRMPDQDHEEMRIVDIRHKTDKQLAATAKNIVDEVIVRTASLVEILRIDATATRAVQKAFRGTAAVVGPLKRICTETEGDAIVRLGYEGTFNGLDDALKPCILPLTAYWYRTNANWTLVDGMRLTTAQRVRHAVLKGGTPELTVDAVLARSLLAIDNRGAAYKLLYGLANGKPLQTTAWSDIGHARARNGRIVATVRIDARTTWRDGDLRITGVTLPDTVMSILAGRGIAALAEHALLEGAVIRHITRKKEVLVVACDIDPVPYRELDRIMSGNE